MSPTADDDARRLREAVHQLELTVAALNGTVKALEATVGKTVTLDRFQALEDDVAGLIKLRDWGVSLVLGTVILALLGLVVVQGGGVR